MSEYLSYGEFFIWTTEISNTDKYENEIIIDSTMSHKSSYAEETYEEIIDENELSNDLIDIITYKNEINTEVITEEITYEDKIINELSNIILNTDTYENEIIKDSTMSHKSSYIGETYEEIIDETKLGDTIINEDKKSTDLIIEENEYKNIVTYEFISDTLNFEKIQTETAKLFTNDKASNIEESYDIIIDNKLSDSLINTNTFKDKISTDFIIEDNSDRNKRTNEKSDKYQTELM